MHIGNEIEETLRLQGRTVTWFAERIGCTRVTVYSIFRHSYIDTDLLYKISHILRHNFFEDYAEDFNRPVTVDGIARLGVENEGKQ